MCDEFEYRGKYFPGQMWRLFSCSVSFLRPDDPAQRDEVADAHERVSQRFRVHRPDRSDFHRGPQAARSRG